MISSGCSSAPPEIKTRTVEIEVKRPDPTPPIPNPTPIDLVDVDFIVLTPENIPEGENWSLIVLAPEQYENLARNNAELLRWIQEAKYRLDYYRGES